MYTGVWLCCLDLISSPFFFYVTGAWDRLKVFEVHVLVSPKVRRGRQGLRRNSPGRPHQHGKPEKRKRENPLRSARPCGRTSLEGFRNLPRRFGGGGGASPTPTGLPDLNRNADQPINRTNEKCFGGGRWELIHGFTSVTDMLEVKRK